MTASPCTGPFQRRQIQRLDHLHPVARQVGLWQPLLYRRGKQVIRISINSLEAHRGLCLFQ